MPRKIFNLKCHKILRPTTKLKLQYNGHLKKCTVRDKTYVVLNARLKQINRPDCCNIFSIVRTKKAFLVWISDVNSVAAFG
jgi:hypothetical protein